MKRVIVPIALLVIGMVGAAALYNPEQTEAGSPADPSALGIKIDLSARQLLALKNSELVAVYPVAVGAPEHPTPLGTFSVRRIIWNPRWVPPDAEWAADEQPREPGDPRNPMGKVKIFFREPDYYIHGTRAVDSLGQAESHGCIRMRNSDAVALARMVMNNGGAPRPASWFQRMVNRVRATQEVRLWKPVTVRVVT
jgi:lipoprotein-anchoring transpeptidase ErfK/SrfK